jgi:hypothetical protein
VTKILTAACMVLLILTVSPQTNPWAKYKAVEAYEVRPGILMFPSYTEDGKVCQIGLERRHYSPEIIRLESTLAREDVDAIVDELAPASERGPKLQNLLNELMLVTSPGRTTFELYENVTVEIEGREKPADDVAAVIKWTHRKCKGSAATPKS